MRIYRVSEESPTRIDPLVSGGVALSVSLRILSKLVEKGLLSQNEVFHLLQETVGTFSVPSEKTAAIDSIKAIMPRVPL